MREFKSFPETPLKTRFGQGRLIANGLNSLLYIQEDNKDANLEPAEVNGVTYNIRAELRHTEDGKVELSTGKMNESGHHSISGTRTNWMSSDLSYDKASLTQSAREKLTEGILEDVRVFLLTTEGQVLIHDGKAVSIWETIRHKEAKRDEVLAELEELTTSLRSLYEMENAHAHTPIDFPEEDQ